MRLSMRSTRRRTHGNASLHVCFRLPRRSKRSTKAGVSVVRFSGVGVMSDTNGKLKWESAKIPCEEIQGLLFDYMNRELGEKRSALIRQHLEKCPECQRTATEIQETMDVLEGASKDRAGVPERLSDDHRARIVFAFTHPVLDWVYHRHILVSAIITLTVLLLLCGALYRVKLWKARPNERVVPVTIGKPPDALISNHVSVVTNLWPAAEEGDD